MVAGGARVGAAGRAVARGWSEDGAEGSAGLGGEVARDLRVAVAVEVLEAGERGRREPLEALVGVARDRLAVEQDAVAELEGADNEAVAVLGRFVLEAGVELVAVDAAGEHVDPGGVVADRQDRQMGLAVAVVTQPPLVVDAPWLAGDLVGCGQAAGDVEKLGLEPGGAVAVLARLRVKAADQQGTGDEVAGEQAGAHQGRRPRVGLRAVVLAVLVDVAGELVAEGGGVDGFDAAADGGLEIVESVDDDPPDGLLDVGGDQHCAYRGHVVAPTMSADQTVDANFVLNFVGTSGNGIVPPTPLPGRGGAVVPPDTSIDSGAPALVGVATATFAFTSSPAGSTFECRVDSGAFASCGSPYTTGALGDGAHTFEVRAVAAAGTRDPSPASQAFTVDTTDPSITGSRVPAANAFGWNDSPVTVKFACTDTGSGIAACEPDVPLVDETLASGATISGAALDNAGHSATTTVGPVKIDLTSPTLTAAATQPPNGLGWYRGDVTIAWTAQDGLSGIDAATVPGDTVMHGEGAGLTAAPQTVKDKAGNQASALGPVVNIDRTNPTITAATDPASPNPAGWFNAAVTVTFTCADALSGVKACSGPRVFDHDGTALSASGVASDNAENTAGASLDAIKIDTHAPQTVAALACNKVNGYCNGSTATVTLAATDPAPAAGVITSGVREVQYRTGGAGAWSVAAADHAQATIALSGSGTALVEYRAIDNAGNSESVGASRIDYDTIAPTVTHTLNPAANAFGWNNTDLLVHFAATDDNSGVQAATITADRTVNVETAATTIDGQATDVAGNIGKDSLTVKLDKTKPTISATATGTPGADGWYTSVVTVHFTCSDPGPIASQIAACTSDQILDHGQSVTSSATDRADNTAATTFGPVNVDGAKPTIQINGIASGAIYLLHGVPAPSCVATDVGPAGIDGGCQITVTGGLANGVGTFTYTANAKDKAGNATTATGSYQVRYAIKTGTAFWLQPINDTAHTVGATTSDVQGRQHRARQVPTPRRQRKDRAGQQRSEVADAGQGRLDSTADRRIGVHRRRDHHRRVQRERRPVPIQLGDAEDRRRILLAHRRRARRRRHPNRQHRPALITSPTDNAPDQRSTTRTAARAKVAAVQMPTRTIDHWPRSSPRERYVAPAAGRDHANPENAPR